MTSPWGGTASPRSGWHHRGFEDGLAGRTKRQPQLRETSQGGGVPLEFWPVYTAAYRRGVERAQRVKA